MDNPSSDDEVAIDPLPMPSIPVPGVVLAIAGRARRQWPAIRNWGRSWRGGLVATVAAVVVIGVLRLTGVLWTTPPPAWISALGPSVTVTGPEQAAPGHGSPGAVVVGALAALSSDDPAAACGYLYGQGAQCEAALSHTPRDQRPYVVSIKIGYVATDGTRGLVGFTGKICSPGNTPECVTNTDPAAIFSGGSSFTMLWTQTTSATFGNSEYLLQACFETGGKWYLGTGPSTESSYASRVNAPSRRGAATAVSLWSSELAGLG
ncbi:MAG TPA: hypothetical protein VMG38_09750 [Trebonia sp.]|nr:hypothetical protein [Trebonia sp.]